MKKVLIMILIVVTIAITGCGMNTPVQLWQAVKDSESILAKQITEVDDDVFWTSAKVAAELISNTMEPVHDYRVEVWLETDDGEPIKVERAVTVQFSNKDWRQLWRNTILIELATDDLVVKTHNEGKIVKVTGSVLEFLDYENDHKLTDLVDTDNNGVWDGLKGGGK